MRNSPWYIASLVAFVFGAAGYVYGTSEVVAVRVSRKAVEETRGRRSTLPLYVVYTDLGRLPILTLPVIGYSTGVEDVHARIAAGSSITVRVGNWPPAFVGGSQRYILSVY